MNILAIESSCDETGAAVICDGKILSNVVATQEEVHARFGGVVPELASRRHLEVIIPMIQTAMEKANVTWENLEGIAATYAPGLIGSLLVGLTSAKTIALAKHLPFIAVNHLEAHLNAHLIDTPDFPAPSIGLVISGGHTSLYLVRAFGDYSLLGATRDDAAGEAFDKVAKLLELGYPGGPLVDKLAQKGNPHAYTFTLPRFGSGNQLDFSFSGLKTAVLLKVKEAKNTNTFDEKFKQDLAASFQATVIKIVVKQVFEAAKIHNAKGVVISGGVAANSLLRSTLQTEADKRNLKLAIPKFEYCTDNAAMIAYVGEQYLKMGKQSSLDTNAIANMEIGTHS
ncbi:MAG: tRNA (adenosine(37)-N6)-threonylcarbamoyltransferase complex transferase subunit TsaD [Deltaproteobacteria bacterium CG_4_10_14_0_2_um_filter_43_8]|nr:MAG: tRNA (adenosine(37)-N6)-threonylcarbamoyltransferase complex transferase subunit TsaD [Deltaproteobacteria bacterium CG11_big_fil_rev_8_21_14_0_20_42_23]PJA20969.1 MAG: tRNA (adenosine(37)-N6)-threonylcarbamoyltransferase complex transferase subunit TsaD [Deltaproteobacteria bacterium CG_4_10_14_0_2_um_filter_43_8]PJC63657.1 MAG: tRNA (adenosine(37)-N6)-threonylcarbamoyltransferase complex transferase subunit TsaD [Deltaproteobacteria bacterium CG_4_9_14_0_2_um_filter_42_21]